MFLKRALETTVMIILRNDFVSQSTTAGMFCLKVKQFEHSCLKKQLTKLALGFGLVTDRFVWI